MWDQSWDSSHPLAHRSGGGRGVVAKPGVLGVRGAGGWGGMGREGQGAGDGGMKYRVDDISLFWGRVRADGAAKGPLRSTLGAGGGGGRRSCRILCEWRPLEFMPHSGPVCVGACNCSSPDFLLPSPPSPPPLCRAQKEVMVKGERILLENLNCKGPGRITGPVPRPSLGPLSSHKFPSPLSSLSSFPLTSQPVFSSLRTFDPASEKELCWRR